MKKNKRISKLWKDVRVKDIALKIHYGYTTSAVYENTGIKFLRITDIQDYKVAWNMCRFVKSMKMTYLNIYLKKKILSLLELEQP